jgi:hypothetical protein
MSKCQGKSSNPVCFSAVKNAFLTVMAQSWMEGIPSTAEKTDSNGVLSLQGLLLVPELQFRNGRYLQNSVFLL